MQAKIEKLCIALIFLYHLLYATAFFETLGIFLNPVRARAMSLGLIVLLAFITQSPCKNKLLEIFYKAFAVAVILATTGYIVFGYHIFEFRVGSAVGFEVILGLLAIGFVLESTRFTSGKVVVGIAIGFLLYTVLGQYVPGFFRAPPASITLISGQTYLGLMGIYGVPTGIIIDYVFGFVLFGYVLQAVGGLDFFVRISHRLFGKMRGAGAKVAITTNLLFGMVQGSTLAAVLVTGPLTIPQMRKEGYSERYMGGLIAAAADAAQLMPPVMGIVAFVMAEYLHVPYIKVCIAAFVPGLLYYFSLFLSSHLEAVRHRVNPPPAEDQLPPLWKLVTKYWHCVAAFALLIGMLASQTTTIRLTMMATTIFLLAAGSLRKETRPTLDALRSTVVDTAKSMVAVAPVCATAGIIIASIGTSALDYKFSAQLTDIAGQNLILLLLLATIACMVLGMGMPTLPAYIVVVMLVAPTLLSLGMRPIVVHMFVFYMALAAMLTPPVCLNVFAVAPMVRSSLWKTGLTAVVIGAARYAIPFVFVYRAGLLMVGSAGEIVEDISVGLLIVLAICFAQSRYGVIHTKWPEIVAALGGAFLLFYPLTEVTTVSQIAGAVLLASTAMSQAFRFLRRHRPSDSYHVGGLRS